MSNSDRKYQVVIVDDDEVELFILQRLVKIKKLASDITTFRSGRQLIKALENKDISPDFVLLNYKLLYQTGVEVLKRIERLQEQDKLDQLPYFVITSSTTDLNDLTEIMDNEMVSGFLSKPIMPNRMVELLHAIDFEEQD